MTWDLMSSDGQRVGTAVGRVQQRKGTILAAV